MERLTKRTESFTVFKRGLKGEQCPDMFCRHAATCTKVKNRACPYLQMIDRLAAYEETGLEPEEVSDMESYKLLDAYELEKLFAYLALGSLEHIQYLIQTEQECRLVVLPCKVGQTIYEVVRLRGGGYSHINPMTVVGIHIGDFPDLRGHKRKSYLVVTHPTSDILGRVSIDKIGKTVFLTRKEAEAALEAQKGDKQNDAN